MRASLPTLALLVTVGSTSVAMAEPIFIQNAKVYVKPGVVQENTNIHIEDGLIKAIGAKLSAPAGAKIIEARGLNVYPGLIHGYLRSSVTEPSTTPTESRQLTTEQIAQERMTARDKDPFGQEANLLSAQLMSDLKGKKIDPFSSLAHQGFSYAHFTSNGGIVGASSATFNLSAGQADASTLTSDTRFIPVNLGGRSFGSYPGSTMGTIAVVRQALADAKWLIAQPDAEKSVGLRIAALTGVFNGKARLVFDDLNEVSFYQAYRISEEFNLKPIYVFRSDAARVAHLVKEQGGDILLRGVIPTKPSIGSDLSTSSVDGVRSYFNELQVGAELAKAGIKFGYAPSSTGNPLEGIRSYYRAGLDHDSALASVTTNMASILGLSIAGTLETGKEASLVIVNGSLFNGNSQIMATIAKGVQVTETLPERKPREEIAEEATIPVLPPNYEVFPRPAETKVAHRLYRGATIWTAAKAGILKNADIRIQNGKIVEVGTKLNAPAGCEVIDAKGMHISPGIWDCHSHTGIAGGVNEGSNMITAECRIADVIDHTSLNIYQQLAGGTVGANQLHGSANAIGGQNSVVKWRWGQSALEFPMKGAPEGVKFALGQNPIREDSTGLSASPIGTTLLTFRPRTRFGVEEAISRGLQLGKEYNESWADYRSGKTKSQPRRDLQLEALGEMVDGSRWVHSHGYRADEMLTLIRVAEEYGVRLATLQHVLEGYKIADEMAASNVGGSTFSDWWGYKFEAYDAVPHNATLMARRGVSVSINSDSADQSRRLNHEAAKAIRYGGASDELALTFVTIEPAKQLGIDKWTGSIEVGKDADLAFWTDNPLQIGTVCLQTYVDGIKRFDRNDDIQQRADREKYLAEAKKILTTSTSGNGDDPFVTSNSELEAGSDNKEDLTPSTANFGLSHFESEPGSLSYSRAPLLVSGGTVHPMDGDPFIGDVLVGSNGKIVAVGKNISAPRGAVRVNAKGKHVYPGLIDPSTTLGINEIGQVPTTDDSSERGDFHPQYRVERAINPDWESFGVARAEGVLAAIVRPGSSGIAGQAALIYTEGFTWEDLTIKGGIAMTINGTSSGSSLSEDDCLCSGVDHNHMMGFDDGDMMAGQRRGGGGGGGVSASLATLTTRLTEAREYDKKVKASTPEAPVRRDISMEAMLIVAMGDTPIMVRANSATDIKAAVAWAEEQRVRLILYGCSEAGEIAEWLAAKKVPIILDAVYTGPRGDQPFDYFYSLPYRLHKAGVKFCLTTNDAHNVRYLRDLAGWAAAFGMDREEATRLITLRTAEVLGISNRIGALKPGLDGTLIITDGEIIETRTRVLQAFIQGREVSLENRQTRLYEKYKARPIGQKN